ncbi:MAG: RNA 2',3'-cyclic phosphodiesterase [Pacificimonas sp.]
MHRLFIGIDPPTGVKDTLIEIMGGVIGARWQGEDQLHMTLRFLGERTHHESNDIAEALAGVTAKPVTLAVNGVGTFDRRGRIDQLWAGIRPPDDAKRLHKKVTRALTAIGVEPETRSFHPHITLARFSRGAGPLTDFLIRHGDLRLPAFEVTEFCLYESTLTGERAEYDIIARYDFAQGNLVLD